MSLESRRRRVRSTKRLLACGLVVIAAGGCASTSPGPLNFGGYGNTLEPHENPPYFGVDVCSEDGVKTVAITKVRPGSVTGSAEPISFRIAWPDGQRFQRVISSHEALPDAYLPVRGARGEVGTCGEDPDRYAALAVVFPPTKRRPITVDGVSVTYQVDGDVYTGRAEVLLTQCPAGTHPRSGVDDGALCTNREEARR